MEEHVHRVVDDKMQSHYLSHKIQNELINLIANAIKQIILGNFLKAEYFSIVLDCTPDLSHQEQMSIVIRCVDVYRSNVKVEEFFLEFIKVDDTSGLGLFKQLENILINLNLNLDIDNIRDQGYDNGSNMKGKKQGIQKRLLDINPKALYVPCGCHSLNLALCDMSKSCQKVRDFFMYVQKIYTLFSGSTTRWSILEKYVKELTPKSLSITRWESHIDSVRAIRMKAPLLRDALIEIANTSNDDNERLDAKSLCKNALEDFEFLVGLCVWYKVLDKFNRVSKLLQKEEMNMEEGLAKIKELIVFFQNFRENGFESLMEEANELAEEVGIDPIFPKKRIVRRKKHFDEDVEVGVEVSQTPKEKFKVTYFLHIIDQALSSLKHRFETFRFFEEIFGFLFIAKLRSSDHDYLLEHCNKLEKFLTHNGHCDINGRELYGELRELKVLLPKGVVKSIDVRVFLSHYREDGGFRNAWISYRILLTIPVTVASAERSFSKLKLIKNFLRTSMSQERLCGLALISIEDELLETLKYDDLVESFASKNTNRSIFL